MMKKKALIIGLGNIGFEYDLSPNGSIESHAKALMNSNEYRLVAAVDLNQRKLRKFCEYYPDVKVSTSISDIEIDYRHIDMAVIAVPTDKHLEILNELKIFENLKYIVLEKPAGQNIFEAQKIQELTRENHWDCYVNYIRRSDTSVAHIKNSVKKYTEFQVRCIFDGDWLNIGSHFIDLILYIFQLHEKDYSISTYENNVIIKYNNISISIEKIHFQNKSNNFYELYIYTPKEKFYYLDGGYDVFSKSMSGLTEEKSLIKNNMFEYQKLFYASLSAITNKHQENKILCDIDQSVEVHRILREVRQC